MIGFHRDDTFRFYSPGGRMEFIIDQIQWGELRAEYVIEDTVAI